MQEWQNKDPTALYTQQTVIVCSVHNQIKIAIRNRISPESMDDLFAIKEEGKDLSVFDFQATLNHTEKAVSVLN